MDSFSDILARIKQKPELKGLNSQIIKDSITDYTNKNNVNLEKISEKDLKIIVKDIRHELRKLSGRFKLDYNEKEYGDQIKRHISARERMQGTKLINILIKKLKVNSVLDLGCGLNPLAIATPQIEYYASDIDEDSLNLVRDYFEKNKIFGRVFVQDLRKPGIELPKSDFCMMLKLLDVLENKGHKLAERLITLIPAKFILVSFSTKTLSGKPMNHPQRGWIERMLSRLKYRFASFKTSNEIFYLVFKEEASLQLISEVLQLQV